MVEGDQRSSSVEGTLYNFSFSPGDVIRIIDLIPTELKAVVLGRGRLRETILDVPLFYKGDFLLIPDPGTYETVDHLVSCIKIGEKKAEQPRFQNKSKISLAEGGILKKGEKLALLGIEEGLSGKMLKCQLIKRENNPVVRLPMNCRGMFQECHDDNYYTLDQILTWKIPVGRSRAVKPVPRIPECEESFSMFPKDFSGQLVLQPTYRVKALLAGGAETMIPTELDFEIVDITDAVTRKPFVAPICLEDIYAMPNDKFPLTVQILGDKDKSSLIAMSQGCNPTFFDVGKCLTILQRAEVKKYLVTEVSQHSAMKHFLVPRSYRGIFQRVPRTFQSVYDLELARERSGVIKVIATQCYAADIEGLSSFRAGDGFRAIKRVNISTSVERQLQYISVLECEKCPTYDKVLLPMHAIGEFLEVLEDRKRFTIQELLAQHNPPCHAKVIAKDQSLPSDLLFDTSELKVDGEVNMKYLVAKCAHASAKPFEIPVELVKVMVAITSKDSPFTDERVQNLPLSETIGHLSADDYTLLKGCDAHPAPPPLPPKSRSTVPSCYQNQIAPVPPRMTKKSTHADPFPLLHDETAELLSKTHLHDCGKLQNIYFKPSV
ncbi:protein THEMIS3-like [Mustelus asterias]